LVLLLWYCCVLEKIY